MKTWKLVSGIISIVLFAFVIFQSCAAGISNSLAENGESGGSAGLIVAIILLAGGIVSIAKHDLKISQIIKNSGISQSYAHEILNGTKPHPSRDYLLALCLGAHMDLKTTQHALRIAQLGELYAKVPRDAAIMMHINNEKWNLIDINIFLEEHGLNVISLSKKIS